jgi:hypothetical protein
MWLFRQPFDAQQDAVKDGWSIAQWVGYPNSAWRVNTAARYTRIVPIVRGGVRDAKSDTHKHRSSTVAGNAGVRRLSLRNSE